ncbi:MAG: hypothetical protein ACPGXZ_04860 [Saprospiraceae bacterium]
MTISNILADTSRVWIYQSNQAFSAAQAQEIQLKIKAFCKSWVSHSNQLKADGALVHNRFVVLSVDESQAGASGCSIDKSVHFIKGIEQTFGVNMFDRMLFAYQNQAGEVKTASSMQFSELYKDGLINDDTLVFDNLVKTKADFQQKWLKPLKDSWHARFV